MYYDIQYDKLINKLELTLGQSLKDVESNILGNNITPNYVQWVEKMLQAFV